MLTTGVVPARRPGVTSPRDKLEHRIQHSQTRTQDRHDHHIAADLPARRLLERRVDEDVVRRHVTQGFDRQQHADALRGPAEFVRAGPAVTQRDEGILDERVAHDVDGHEVDYTLTIAD